MIFHCAAQQLGWKAECLHRYGSCLDIKVYLILVFCAFVLCISDFEPGQYLIVYYFASLLLSRCMSNTSLDH